MSDETILRAVLDQWREAVNAHEPGKVAALFTEDAIFQGLRPYSVGPAGVEDYYAGQPLGLRAEYEVQETRRLAGDVLLGYVAVDFTFPDGRVAEVQLGLLLRGDRIAHYQVSPRPR
ncbi:uncharacterized protein (TIGR02246 family) [Crossiella equi]|uniref:Uncharacterized protein (TIGR02246 family) n=1 Tax=Crossiella equi TaxID=130796 RepID=A0ABS5ARF9_9PSEU|nr:SgcJ/EcaC family oxidoreductase [Crossiella equi]MBP2479159.1 uncharacterized protein (TIGR02246 family) [Crossiella equi]